MNRVVIQMLASFIFAVPTFMLAVANTWPSYALQILGSNQSPLGYKITTTDGSLLGSAVMLGALTTILVAGYVCNKIGRKRTEILVGLSYTLAWSTITTAKGITQLLIGRYTLGLGAGFHFAAGTITLSEITQVSIRGNLMSIMSLMYSIGTAVSYLEGWFCSYEVINYLNLTISVCFVLLMSFMKDTPVYLLTNGREKEAIKSLKFYRGASTVTQEILDELGYLKSHISNGVKIDNHDLETPQINNEKEKLNKENAGRDIVTEQKSAWSTLRTSKSAQRALVILTMTMVLTFLTGIMAVQAYAGQFFIQAVPHLSPHVCSVILAIVFVVTSGLSVAVTDLYPRRVLMIVSSILCSACMTCLVTMLRWSWAPEWGIPLLMVLFCTFYQIGVANIPFIQIGECLPPQINSFGTPIVMFSLSMTNFGLLYVFKPAVEMFGLDGVFLLFAIMSAVTAIMTYFFMRETRRVPFEMIQNSFERGYLYRS